VILLLNAWELLLKALLSKNGQSIYEKKRRNHPYRTLGWRDSFPKAEKYFPTGIDASSIRADLGLISTYRDNSVHFYNARDFGVVLYALSQTAIINYKDVAQEAFGLDLSREITWQLLPLGLRTPIDPIEYIAGRSPSADGAKAAVKHYLAELAAAVKSVEESGGDTGRLLTVFDVKLESVKKIGSADVLVGIEAAGATDGPLAIFRPIDPNKTHPLRQKDIVSQIGKLGGRRFTQHVFQALVWKHELKKQARYCWIAEEGVLTKYSRDVIPFLKQIPSSEVDRAIAEYSEHLKRERSRRRS
jgi:hypothetical protein